MFESLFDIARQDCEEQAGTILVDHPLTKQLEACHSVESVATFLQERAQAFHEFRISEERWELVGDTLPH